MIYDIAALNSATKYPSIPTYHALDPKDGSLIEAQPTEFSGQVVLTEKIDGAGARIIVLPGGDFLIGSREELLHARGDRIVNPVLGIVPGLLPVARMLGSSLSDQLKAYVFYLEVYGASAKNPAVKQYTKTGVSGWRLFDIATIPMEVLDWPVEKIAGWREHGGQDFLPEDELAKIAAWEHMELTPRLGVVDGAKLPRDLTGMLNLLTFYVPETRAALDDSALGAAEGVVLRSEDRSVIAKAKFSNCERTLRRREGKR